MKRGILCLTVLFVAMSAAVADDWHQLRHDAGHTNSSSAEARWPFTLLWRTRIDRGLGGRLDAPGILPMDDRLKEGTWETRMGGDVPWPVFADGRVFVGTRDGRLDFMPNKH
jgi:hypothetical protein